MDVSTIEQARAAIHWRDRLTYFVRRMFWKIRVDVCFGESDGFDVGAFCYDWKRSRGPFMIHRQDTYGRDSERPGPWRLMIALTPAAYRGFDDGVGR